MCLRKAVQIALFIAAIAAVVAEPPAAYGPPSFNQFQNYDIGVSKFMRHSGQFDYQRGYQSRGQHRQYDVGYERGGYQETYNNVAPQPFNFQYEVKDPQSGNDFGHQASSNGNQVRGEYYVLLPDGRRQIVTYVADDNGYNADVHYEGQAVVPQTGGYGGYSDNQYGGYKGNTGGYSGNTGGYKGNTGGYRGNFGGYKGNFGGHQGNFGGHQGNFGGHQGSFGGYQGNFGGYRY